MEAAVYPAVSRAMLRRRRCQHFEDIAKRELPVLPVTKVPRRIAGLFGQADQVRPTIIRIFTQGQGIAEGVGRLGFSGRDSLAPNRGFDALALEGEKIDIDTRSRCHRRLLSLVSMVVTVQMATYRGSREVAC